MHDAGFCLCTKSFIKNNNIDDFLHRDELDYLEKLKVEQRRQSFLLGRIAAKQAIASLVKVNDLTTIAIQYGVFQFPVVKHNFNNNLQVTISHSHDVGVALAFCEEHPMGVDIERIVPARLNAIKDNLSDSELELLENSRLSLIEGCTAIWTMKEGLSKALKTGLTVDFKVLEIILLKNHGLYLTCTFKYFAQYKAICFPVSDYFCSIVLPRNTDIDSADIALMFSGLIIV